VFDLGSLDKSMNMDGWILDVARIRRSSMHGLASVGTR
jgi:hypothetical protein